MMSRSMAIWGRFADTHCPPEVPADPFFELEAATIRVYSKVAASVGNRLLAFWQSQGELADAKVNREKFSIKAHVFRDHTMCTVKVRLYRDNRPGLYAVEFQRRAGDAVLFNRIYQRARHHLQQCFSASPRAPRVAALHDSSGAAAAETHAVKRSGAADGTTLCPLLDMARSADRPALQAEAAAALAHLAQDHEAAGSLCTEGAFEALLKLLQSDHLEILLPAARILQMLARCPEGVSCFASTGLLGVVLGKVFSRATRLTVRQELAKALRAELWTCWVGLTGLFGSP